MEHEIILSNATDLLRVSATSIMAIMADGNCSDIILNDGDKRCVAFQIGMLSEIIEQQLGPGAPMFVRVGRSYIVNMEYLFAINMPHKRLIVRSDTGCKVTLSPSKEALRDLKELVDKTKIG